MTHVADIVIRKASREDVATVVEMIRQMVTDMAGHGGHAPAVDAASWDTVATGIAEDLDDVNCKFAFAETSTAEIAGLGGAKLVTLGGAYASKKTMHVSVVYVRPEFRRRHIADALMRDMLAWGASAGAVECDLNVLTNSPAKSLYAKHGFSLFQAKMVRSLSK